MGRIGKRMAGRKAVFAINWMEVDALVQARHENPHHILGMHECIDDVYVNVYLPDAKIVKIRNLETKKSYTLVSERVKGFFSVVLKDTKTFPYEVKAKFEDGVLDICVPKAEPEKVEGHKYIAIEG